MLANALVRLVSLKKELDTLGDGPFAIWTISRIDKIIEMVIKNRGW